MSQRGSWVCFQQAAMAQSADCKVERVPSGVAWPLSFSPCPKDVGVDIVGHGAVELISEAALAIEMGANVKDLALTVHPHPTLSETIMEAAEVYYGHSAHFFTKKPAH